MNAAALLVLGGISVLSLGVLLVLRVLGLDVLSVSVLGPALPSTLPLDSGSTVLLALTAISEAPSAYMLTSFASMSLKLSLENECRQGRKKKCLELSYCIYDNPVERVASYICLAVTCIDSLANDGRVLAQNDRLTVTTYPKYWPDI